MRGEERGEKAKLRAAIGQSLAHRLVEFQLAQIAVPQVKYCLRQGAAADFGREGCADAGKLGEVLHGAAVGVRAWWRPCKRLVKREKRVHRETVLPVCERPL